MIVRNKAGDYAVHTGEGLLAFLRGELGMEDGAGGVRDVQGGIELICSVPFCLVSDTGGEQSNRVLWTFSTFDLDRFSERIDPAGWDYKRYTDNPVVEWAHRYDIPAIGKADGLYTDEKGLHGSVIFNSKDYDPFGWGIGERVKARVIRAGSVGFRVIEIEIPGKDSSGTSYPQDGTTLIFRKQELLEFSICNVPANPFALSKTANVKKTELTQELGGSMFWGGLLKF
jgi:HK97 family phage prohead protease